VLSSPGPAGVDISAFDDSLLHPHRSSIPFYEFESHHEYHTSDIPMQTHTLQTSSSATGTTSVGTMMMKTITTSPISKSKSRLSASSGRVGSWKWKLQKVVRDVESLETYCSNPSLSANMTGAHDPRNRVQYRIRVEILDQGRLIAPFCIYRVQVVFTQNMNEKEIITLPKHALLILKADSIGKLKYNDNVQLYDPIVMNLQEISSQWKRTFLMKSLITFYSTEQQPIEEFILGIVWERIMVSNQGEIETR
jgi:hypothetical protein